MARGSALLTGATALTRIAATLLEHVTAEVNVGKRVRGRNCLIILTDPENCAERSW